MSDSESTQPSSPSKGGAATATAIKPQRNKKPRHLPPWHVILLNDDDHSYEYVIEMLRALFGYDETRGYSMAQEVDKQGRVIVLTTHKERAEFKRDQIHAYGTDLRVATCKGSMSSILEPAEG